MDIYVDPRKFFNRATERLIKAVKVFVGINKPDKQGVTKLQQYKQVEKTLGHAPKDLLVYNKSMTEVKDLKIWQLYWNIRNGLFSDEPLSMRELKAYFELTEEYRSVGRIKLLKFMDRVYLND